MDRKLDVTELDVAIDNRMKVIPQALNSRYVRIIDQLLPNDDRFSWKQLNCFYKPLGMIFGSFQQQYNSLFLMYVTYYSTYMAESWFQEVPMSMEDLLESFFEYYEDYLKKRFLLDIQTHTVVDEADFRRRIVEQIDRNARVLVPGDLYTIYYDNWYKAKHHQHFFLIKGYDQLRDICYVLDSLQIDGGTNALYKDFTIPFNMLYDTLAGYAHTFAKQEGTMFFWTVSDHGNSTCGLSMEDALKDHLVHLREVEAGKVEVKYPEREITRVINANGYDHNTSRLLESTFLVMNMRSVYYQLVFSFIEQAGAEKPEVDSLRASREQLDVEWGQVKSKLIYKTLKHKLDFADVDSSIKVLIGKEDCFRSQLIGVLSGAVQGSGEFSTADTHSSSFTPINEKNAEIVIQQDQIILIHTSEKLNLSSIAYDNAPQALMAVGEHKNCNLEAKVQINASVGRYFKSGLMLKFGNGTKLLFGTNQGQSLQIEHLGVLNDLMYDEVFLDNPFFLKISKMDNIYTMSYKIKQSEQYTEVYSFHCDEKALAAGFYSLTFEPLDLKSVFSEYKFTEEELSGI